MQQRSGSGIFSFIMLGLFVIIFLQYIGQKGDLKTAVPVDYNQFLRMVESDKFQTVEIQRTQRGGSEIKACCFENKTYSTFSGDDELIRRLTAKPNMKVIDKPIPEIPFWQMLLSWILPTLIFVGLFYFIMRKMTGGVGGAGMMNFGKSKAKLQQGNRVTFADVAGVDESKEELVEMIQFLKDPRKFTKLGGRMPKGVLLIGPPGTGKTLLARAVAGEANVPFFSISGSDFIEMFVGVGASRVRDLFDNAKKNSPCIIFIDEVDAVGGKRGLAIGGGSSEHEQTLNQLMVEMDGFESDTGVVIMAATNRPESLDPAILRPGRFDRHVVVPRPDVKGRQEILSIHAKKIPLEERADLNAIARGTPGFVGADLANLLNEAALAAAKKGQEKVTQKDLDEAKDKIIMGGTERKSMVMSQAQKKTTAYHEAGHTLVAILVPGNDPIHKVTIIPRGMSLGLTGTLPEEERHNYTKSYLNALLPMMMGGRVAEELAFGDISTGASNDIERATALATNMIKKWGMSDRLGAITYGGEEESQYLGVKMQTAKDYSEKTAEAIDDEKKGIIDAAYKKAKAVLTENRNILDHLANELLEKETLTGEAVRYIVDQHKIPQML